MEESMLVGNGQFQSADFGKLELKDFLENCVVYDGQKPIRFGLWFHQVGGDETGLIFGAKFRTCYFQLSCVSPSKKVGITWKSGSV